MSRDSQEKDQEDRALRKWEMIFEFVDLDQDGFVSMEGFMEFPTQLIKRGKVDLGSHLAKVYKSQFEKVRQAVNLPREQQKINRSLWIKGFHFVSKSEWFRKEFVPTLSKGFFDSMDTNGDNMISLEEWRSYHPLQVIDNEEFIRNSLLKMDKNGDGKINRDEFNYAICSFRTYHGPDRDFSFLYNKFKSTHRVLYGFA